MITYIPNMPPIRSEEIWARNRSLKVSRMIALLKTALEVPKRKEPREIPIETYSWVIFLSLKTYREEGIIQDTVKRNYASGARVSGRPLIILVWATS